MLFSFLDLSNLWTSSRLITLNLLYNLLGMSNLILNLGLPYWNHKKHELQPKVPKVRGFLEVILREIYQRRKNT